MQGHAWRATRGHAALATLLCAVLASLSQPLSSQAASVTISNVKPRTIKGAPGTIVSAADGSIIAAPEGYPNPSHRYYMAVMGYGLCEEMPTGCYNVSDGACGFQLNHNVSVYGTHDLAMDSWELLSQEALPIGGRPVGVLFRPHIVWHAPSKQFVLWVRYLPPPSLKSNTYYSVSVSKDPQGPYRTVTNVSATRLFNSADDNLFVDDDGTGYIVYTSRTGDTHIHVDRLTPDFLHSAAVSDPNATSEPLGPGHTEAPAMFKRGSTYYVTFGHLCCYCAGGSDLHVFASSSPLGPYTDLGDIAPNSGTFGQQNFVITLPDASGTGQQFVYWSNRWQTAPDKLKDHDFHYWQPLTFNDTAAEENGGFAPILPLEWQDEWQLTLPDP